jgi:hypothetical protein
MIRKTNPLLLLMMLACTSAIAQMNWEYVNLRQYRVKDMEVLRSFVKSAYPFMNQAKSMPTAGRFIGAGESGRIYAAVYLTNLDQFANFMKERSNVLQEYGKTPGNVSKEMGANIEGGLDDILWHWEKEVSNIPANYEGAKMLWRKLNFVTVKSGMMNEFLAATKALMEAEKKAGINHTALMFRAAYGAPDNMVLISYPAASSLEYYTALAARQKIREANPELVALRRKAMAMTSNVLIDQVTTIPY